MNGLYGRVVFSVGGTDFRWEDVILAASLWGEMGRLRQRVREQIACVGRVDDEDDADAPEADAVARAADEFRYDRDLVAAEEMENWLARWNLSAEEWMDYIRGSVLSVQWSAELPDLLATYEPSDDDVNDGMEVAGICSGMLERVAHDLAGRAAVHDSGSRATLDDRSPSDPLWPFPVRPDESGWPGLDPEVVRSKIDRLVQLERAYQQFCRTAVTPKALEARIREAQLDWTRLECQSLAFSDDASAREAILCMKEDGQRLDEVAADTHGAVQTDSIWLESVDEAGQDRFVAAQRGDIIGPVPRGERFLVYQVLDRVAPSKDDGGIVDRARASIVARLVEQAVNARVKWHLEF